MVQPHVRIEPGYEGQFQIESDVVTPGVHGTSFYVKIEDQTETQDGPDLRFLGGSVL